MLPGARTSATPALDSGLDSPDRRAADAADAEPGHVLEVRDLHKRFGAIEAVRGVGFPIAEGETYGLLGPNGAGKTTTISMVCGLLRRDAGEVTRRRARRSTSATVAAKAAIGYVPQELAIYPDLTARENLRSSAASTACGRRPRGRASTRCST